MEQIKHSIAEFFNGIGKPRRSDATPEAPSKGPEPSGKAVLGNATWTFLHTLAAQYPEEPTRRQKSDAKTLISCMSRMYPCAECSQHFEAYVRRHPPSVECKGDLEQWVCTLHNDVNSRLDKPAFNCRFVRSRWQELDCDVAHSCSLEGLKRPKNERPW